MWLGNPDPNGTTNYFILGVYFESGVSQPDSRYLFQVQQNCRLFKIKLENFFQMAVDFRNEKKKINKRHVILTLNK